MATYNFERETRTPQSESFIVEREGEEVARVDLHYSQATAYATLCVPSDFDDEAKTDVEFHNAVGECSHNIVLLHTLRSCYRLLSQGVVENRLMIFSMPGAREQLLLQQL